MKTLIGIDWSQKHHDIRLHNEAGALLSRFRTAHSWEGFQKLEHEIAQVNAEPDNCLIGIETANNLLVDFLWARQYRLYILAPIVVKSSRGRQRVSAARDDDSDAALLADILRTDRQQLIPWQPDGQLVCQMRVLINFIDDLTASIVQYSNRLRASLQRYYPQVLNAFSPLKSKLCLQFLMAYPTPAAAAALSFAEFEAFCRQHGDTQAKYRRRRFGLLQQVVPVDHRVVATYEMQVPWLAQMLLHLVQQKKQSIRHLQSLFIQHPDHGIFASLPGAGDLLAPKLLAMFGDHRHRLPSPTVIQALAGTCPVTIRSGQRRSIRFRRACNHAFRHSVQQFAEQSVRQSSWAAAYFHRACSRGLTRSHAYRCLANRWLKIIWTLWQRCETYDEAYHLRQIQRHRQPMTIS